MNTNKFLGKIVVISAACVIGFNSPSDAQVTYTTGAANWTQGDTGLGGAFDTTGGVAIYSYDSNVDWGTVQWRNLTTDGTKNGTGLSLQVGQSLTISLSGATADGRGGVQNNGAIGFALAGATGAPSGGNTAQEGVDASRFRVEFIGGASTAQFVGGSTVTSGMPGFADFKSGQTYIIEMISTNQLNFRVAGGTAYNIINLGGSADAGIGRIQIYSRGQNMNAYYTNLVVSNMSAISLSNNTSETSTISSIIAKNNGNNNNIAKSGDGEVILTAANTFGGTVAVNNGTLRIANSSALGGSGAVTVASGGTLALSNGITEDNAMTISGTGEGGVGAVRNVSGNNTLSGAVTLGAATSVKSESGTTTTFSGGFGGTGNGLTVNGAGNTTINTTGINTGSGGALTKNDGGTLYLAASSDYTGTTTINGGVVEVQHGSALGTTAGTTTVADGAILKLSNASGITVAENMTISGTIGDGALQNVSGANTVSGTITLGANTRIGATVDSLSVGAVSGGNNVLYVGGAGNTTISGILSGAGNSQNNTTTSLFKDGAGVLTLSGNNSYSGDTRLAQGTLTVASGGSLGNGTSDVFLSNSTTLNINTDVTVASIREGTNNVAGGVIAIGSGATLTVDGANKGNLYQNNISGQGGLALNASGNTVLGLYGTQSYTGTTTVSGGKLTTAVGLSTAAVSVSGGEFETTANNVLGDSVGVTINGGTFTVGGSDTIGVLSGSGGTLALGSGKLLTSSFNSASNSFAGTISGAGGFVKAGTGTLTLSGVNTYAGGTFLNGGTLDADNSSAFGTGFVIVSSGTTLDLLSHNVSNSITNNGGTVLSSGTVSNVDAEAGQTTIGGDGSTVTQAGGTATVTVTGNDVTVNNVEGSAQVNIGGTGASVGTVGGGTVTLSNGATGATVTTASGGTVNANASGTTLGTVSGSAAVNVGGANGRVGTLSGGSLAANAAGLIVTNYNGGNIAISNGVSVGVRSGSSSGVISGAGGVAKQSTGTLTLSGNNTYTGATTVEAGTLVVNGSIGGSTSVQSGATLAGSGSVGATTIASGGTINPGNSPGTMSLTNGLTFLVGGNYNWQIFDAEGTAGASDGWDLLAVSGGAWNISGLTAGSFNINLWSLSGISPDANGNAINFNNGTPYTWEILTYTSLTGTFDASLFNINVAANNNTAGFSNDVGGGVFSLAVDGNSLNLLFTPGGGPGPSPVPEPGTWAAAALLAGAAGYVRWRRRKEVEQPKA